MRTFFSAADVPDLGKAIAEARDTKAHPFARESLGRHRTLGMVFFNPSLRTRVSTHRAARNLGMDVIVLNVGQDSWQLEFGDGTVMNGAASEHVREGAAVLGEYCDIVALRSFAGLKDRDADYREEVWEKFSTYCGKPVVSLESATRHPLQSFADCLTVEERRRVERPRVVFTWAPHPKALPQAVANSFVEWMRRMPVELVVAHPPEYALAPEFTGGIEVLHDQASALAGADFVYAKNWSSYETYGAVLRTDDGWMVTEKKMRRTNDAWFMHCLPVRRNVVVADTVLDGPRSLVVEEAANRVWTAQTVLARMLERIPDAGR
jgi:N-succinyl-L-ornithine transcarbamylase